MLLLAKLNVAIFVIPYALISRTTQLGKGTFADTGTVTAGSIASIGIATVVLSGVLIAGTAAILDRRDTPA